MAIVHMDGFRYCPLCAHTLLSLDCCSFPGVLMLYTPVCRSRLKPYGILATGPRTGLVEFVSGSLPVSEVLKAHNGSILK